jgi:hypothetical protein
MQWQSCVKQRAIVFMYTAQYLRELNQTVVCDVEQYRCSKSVYLNSISKNAKYALDSLGNDTMSASGICFSTKCMCTTVDKARQMHVSKSMKQSDCDFTVCAKLRNQQAIASPPVTALMRTACQPTEVVQAVLPCCANS